MSDSLSAHFSRSFSRSFSAMSGMSGDVSHPFWILDWTEVQSTEVVVCSVILFLSGVLCSAAGIGGGGIYVSVLMVAGKLTPHDAVPLSKAVVFLGSISSLLLNLRRSASSSKPVIDYNICRLVIPSALIGTFLGVLVNRHSAGSTIVFLLTGLLCLMTFLSARTAASQYSEEAAEEEAAACRRRSCEENAEDVEAERQPMLPTSRLKPSEPHELCFAGQRPCGLFSRRHQIYSLDLVLAVAALACIAIGGISWFHVQSCRAEVAGGALHTPKACAHPVIQTLLLGTAQSWMSGGRSADAMMASLWAFPSFLCMSMMIYYGRDVCKNEGWTLSGVLVYQLMGALTGVLAGLVGVGGGLIFCPFFLLAGLDPSIAVATSSTCVIFTSSSTTMQYLFTDRIVMSLALVYGLINFAASWLGTHIVHLLQDRFSARRSYISCIVCVGVAISAALTVEKFIHLLYHPEAADPPTFHANAH